MSGEAWRPLVIGRACVTAVLVTFSVLSASGRADQQVPDEPTVRVRLQTADPGLLKKTLELRGYDVLWADTAHSAIEVVVSALAARPRQLKAAQKIQPGTAATSDLVNRIAEASKRECKPLDNVEGDADWRHDMVPVVVGRVLSRALGLAG